VHCTYKVNASPVILIDVQELYCIFTHHQPVQQIFILVDSNEGFEIPQKNWFEYRSLFLYYS